MGKYSEIFLKKMLQFGQLNYICVNVVKSVVLTKPLFMKKLIPLLLILSLALSLNAQRHTSRNFTYYKAGEGWNFGINGGPAIFFGDIVSTNKFLPWKHSETTSLFMLRAGKKLIPQINLYASFFAGKLRGTKYHFDDGKPADLAFRAKEYGLALNIRVDFLRMFSFGKDLPFTIYGQVGVGPLWYRVIKVRPSDNKTLANYGYTGGKPNVTFVCPFGFGASFNMAKNVTFDLEMNWFKVTTDKLDGHVGSATTKDDMFNSIMFGVTYEIMSGNKKYY